jgi:putative phage-type endonuclease
MNSQLTQEQMELRQHGIGASEIAAVCGISPWASLLDVWMRKATPTREPLVTTELDSMAIRLGNMLEEPLRAMYTREVGYSVIKPDITFRHPDYPFILATPDGTVEDIKEDFSETNCGLEIKNVGARMVSAWDNGVPDYVELQCRQNMAVLDIDRWDVAALIGGSDFQIFTIERDLELEQTMIEAAKFFWEEYVLKDVPPPENDPGKRRELLKALFPGREGKECNPPEDVTAFYDACSQLAKLKETEKVLSVEKTELENQIISMIGDDYGIEYDQFRFTWGNQAGSTSYKEIAEELAGGKIDPALIEKHRGAPKRVARFTVKKS